MYHQCVLTLPGARQKFVANLSEDEAIARVVHPFVTQGVVTSSWGKRAFTHQVIELRIYKTKEPWNKKQGPLLDHVKRKNNIAKSLIAKVEALQQAQQYRVFVVMPIQGDKFGTQNDQRIHAEYDRRFEALESVLGKKKCVAIRIDKEVPLEDLVRRIKSEISRAQFVVADLTDERPSCYFEAGYAEASGKPVIYMASKESVIGPGKATKVHFDIHMNVNFFSNHKEMQQKITAAIDKNHDILFAERGSAPSTTVSA